MLNPADAAFADRLSAALPEDTLRPLTPAYRQEPRGRYHGEDGVLALPRATDEVAQIVRLCGEARVGIVPFGGGTGLVGGQVMPDGPAPVVLSLERMAAIRAVYPSENVMVAEAGAVLHDVQAAAQAAERLFPLSLASQGSCRIGGNLATNAGGVHVLRYGNARALCLGVEAVLADGSVLHGLKRLRKDNTGYDLRDLLIGSEGSLGILTAASLKLAPIPAEEGAALMVVPGPAAALRLLEMAHARLAEGVSAFELIHRQGLEFLAETMPDLRQPFETPPEWCVLVDVGLPRGQTPEEALEGLFADAAEAGLALDGVIARSARARDDFWTLRESLPEGNRRVGSISSHDISLPLSEIAGFIDEAGAALKRLGDVRINCFGHLGDGNLHYNVFPARGRARDAYEGIREQVKDLVHDMVQARGGSFSAEHGVGRMKVADLERYGDPAALAAMRAIKAALDPQGILNPGVVLRR